MRAKRPLALLAAAVTVIAFMAVGATLGTRHGQEGARPRRRASSRARWPRARRPEAGVWVIAETDDLPTPYRKIVVTDGQGRFVLPELPEADYEVWVRGYGLRDSAKIPATVGRKGPEPPVAITVEDATAPVEAAAIYPANYWLSLFKPPANTEALPGGRNRRLDERVQARLQALPPDGLRPARAACAATAPGSTPASRRPAPCTAPRSASAATPCSTRSPTGARASRRARPPRRRRARRASSATSSSPSGTGATSYTYAHDEIATDKRNPRLNADGKVWGVDIGNDRLLSVDPVHHTTAASEGADASAASTPRGATSVRRTPLSGFDPRLPRRRAA